MKEKRLLHFEFFTNVSLRCYSAVRPPPPWFSGKESASKEADLGSNSALAVDLFAGRVIPVTYKLVLQWLSCQAPGVVRSLLGLDGPVQFLSQCSSTYVHLSDQIHP